MKPYPYQEIGRDFLAGRKRALLADRMGLGKTVQAIIGAKKIGALSTLVVAPASTLPNWEAEWEEWGGPERVRFVSYAKLLREQVNGYAPDLLIADEAHYCKSISAKRTHAALGVARRATYAWLLTGTPMPNDPTELYPAFRYLWPEVLQDLGVKNDTEWMHRFCMTRWTEYGEKPYAVKNGTLLRTVLQSVMLRRSLSDVGLELPPLRVDLHRLPKTELDLQDYTGVEATEEAYTSTLRRLLGVAKANLIAETVADELDSQAYKSIVVLYHHHAVGDILRTTFAERNISVAGFDGSANQTQRGNAIDAFRAGKASVFLAQQTSAGTGLNLQTSSEIILVEPSWSPAENEQAVARIHRIGQGLPCRARIFAVSGTIDEAILGTIRTKLQMQVEVGLKGTA